MFVIESVEETTTATPRKPSARSGPADLLRSSLRSVLEGPGFPEPASPFQSTRRASSP